MKRWFSLVGAVDLSHGRDTEDVDPAVSGRETVITTWTDLVYLGGLRFHPASPSRIVPFAQVLGGGLHAMEKSEYQTVRPRAPGSSNTDVLLIDLGGGVNLMLTDRIGIRLGADVRIDLENSALNGTDTTMARAVAGIVFGLP